MSTLSPTHRRGLAAWLLAGLSVCALHAAEDEPDQLRQRVAQLYREAKLADALPLAERRLALDEERLGPAAPETLFALMDLAALDYALGHAQQAALRYNRAARGWAAATGTVRIFCCSALTGQALSLEALGRYDQADDALARALAIWRQLLGDDGAAPGAPGTGARARELLADVLQRFTQAVGCEPPDYGATLNQYGSLRQSQGRLDEAERYYRAALAVRAAGGTASPAYAQSLNNLATLEHFTGRAADAEPQLRQVLAIWRGTLGEQHPRYAQSLNNLGAVLESLGRASEAETCYRQALAVYRAALGDDHPDTLRTRANVAGVCVSAQRWAEAGPEAEAVVAARERVLGPAHPDYARSLNTLAVIRQCTGQNAEAEQLYRRALAIFEAALGEEHPDVGTVASNLAALLAGTDRQSAALELQQRALANQQVQLGRLLPALSESDKTAFLTTALLAQDRLLALARLRLTDGAAVSAAFNWVLRRKALVLDALLAERQTRVLSSQESTAPLVARLREARLRYAQGAYAGAGAAALASLARQVEEYDRELALRSPAAGALRQAGAATVEAVYARLPRRSALVEVVEYQDYDFAGGQPAERPARYLAFVLTAGTPSIGVIDLGAASVIDAAVQAARAELAAPDPEVTRPALDVRRLVWNRLAPLLAGASTVYLSLDGELALVPFAALPEPDGGFLGEQYVFCHLNSGRNLLADTPPATLPPSLMVVANPRFDRGPGTATGGRPELRGLACPPLPGTAREADTVATLARAAGWPTELLLDAAATKTTLGNHGPPACLHLATHGFFLSSAPPAPTAQATRFCFVPNRGGQTARASTPLSALLRSGLLLAGAANALRGEATPPGADDGILTAEEACTLDLRGTRLVTLSACNTGLGEQRRHEGVLGLRRAFELAGAQSQLLALWQIPDAETVALMKDFYRHYLAGEPVPQALAAAQRAFIEQARAAGTDKGHPTYWAAFVAQVAGR